MMEIPLSRGLVTLVDDCDFDWLMHWKWRANPTGKLVKKFRAQAHDYSIGRGRSIFMHRVIMRANPGEVVDHINGDALDNRRSNLRICDQRKNMINSIGWSARKNRHSGFKGVHWQPHRNKWSASFRNTYLGIFTDPAEAARAYDVAALAFDPNFARLNFPLEA